MGSSKRTRFLHIQPYLCLFNLLGVNHYEGHLIRGCKHDCLQFRSLSVLVTIKDCVTYVRNVVNGSMARDLMGQAQLIYVLDMQFFNPYQYDSTTYWNFLYKIFIVTILYEFQSNCSYGKRDFNTLFSLWSYFTVLFANP